MGLRRGGFNIRPFIMGENLICLIILGEKLIRLIILGEKLIRLIFQSQYPIRVGIGYVKTGGY